ncbi:hypothetical protein BKA08_000002 [Nocardioides marinisabuli]|uniref:DUF1772 domain-containing protein n=1 Tax=Nocardioides marinisabuli TaxID=419476 RepID=A0A7Y9JQK2_9ACTN|nr:hypothetical protein [Nocardioides marinisabuli]NYD55764.1 hypothetical protein [Nocardioides marinisabuli]
MAGAAELALALVAAAHLGFQATVTALVYPALARTGVERWADVHDRHSRRITPLVGLLYPALVVAGAGVALAGPSTAGWVALAGVAVSVLATAAVAAPTHARLGRLGPRPDLLRRLLVADRVRLIGAVVAAAGGAGLLV